MTAAAVLVGAAPASATAPGENGRIVFRRYFNAAMTWGGLLSIQADGTRERQITHPRRSVLDTDPEVSPNGRWIVHARRWQLRRTAFGDPRGALFRIRMNGTQRENLTGATCRPGDDCVRDFAASWSPHGRRIAFSRIFRSETREWEIDLFVMRADGTHVRQITAPGPGFEDYAPQWSPDGSRLVFFRFDPNREESASHALFIVRPDGTHLRRLTTYHLNPAQGQDWSPNGRWIVFSAKPAGQTFNLRMIHPNGTGLHRVTRSSDVDWLRPCFSPDGKRIVAPRTGGVGSEGNADVFVMRLDGSHRQNITRSEEWDSAPDWGPRRK